MAGVATQLRRSSLGRTARTHPVAVFIVLAFGWTWGYGSLALRYVDAPTVITQLDLVPAIWGPPFAAAVVIWLADGDLRAWAGQVRRWQVRPRWYLVAVGLPIFLTELRSLLVFLAGYPVEYGGLRPPWLYLGGFLLLFFTMGALEEFGWRGFLQPILQDRYTALGAGLVIGALWACWHYYLFFHPVPWTQDVNLLLYTARLVTVAPIYAWLYNGTGGSVLLVMIYHAAGNLAGILQPATDLPAWLAFWVGTPATVILQVLLVAALAWRYGTETLAPDVADIEPDVLLGRDTQSA